MSWPYGGMRSWEILMKWHAAGPREERTGGRQIQEKSDGQARVSLTCRTLAAGWAESCQEVSGTVARMQPWNSDLGLEKRGGR